MFDPPVTSPQHRRQHLIPGDIGPIQKAQQLGNPNVRFHVGVADSLYVWTTTVAASLSKNNSTDTFHTALGAVAMARPARSRAGAHPTAGLPPRGCCGGHRGEQIPLLARRAQIADPLCSVVMATALSQLPARNAREVDRLSIPYRTGIFVFFVPQTPAAP